MKNIKVGKVTGRKIGYLTIDDAPTDDFVNKVKFLYKNDIPAIFFCIGRSVNRKREKDVIYAIKKGFIIGNHSWNHFNFNELSRTEIRKEITKADKLIDRLYKKAKVEREIKVFRFPFLQKGKKNKSFIQDVLKELGYSQPEFKGINYHWYKSEGHHKDADVYCTYDMMDWIVAIGSSEHGIKTLKDLFNRMDEDVPEEWRGLNNKGSNEIFMMHDDARIKEMFQPLIKRLIKKGIKFELPEVS